MIDDFKAGRQLKSSHPSIDRMARSLRLQGHQKPTMPLTPPPEPSPTNASLPLPQTAYQPTRPTIAQQGRVKRFSFTMPLLSKSQKIIAISVAAILLLGGGSALWFLVIHKKPLKQAAQQIQAPAPAPAPVVVPPAPTTGPSPLTGVEVPLATQARPVTAIMIENSPEARPQSGIDKAGVVYEAIAEGGITRFLTLYQEGQPDYIGPVRSVRPYYIDWLMPYDAGVAHVGGSQDALNIIRSPGHKDLDQFFNSATYWRIQERYAPHNVYTSMAKLDALQTSKGFTKSTFTGWPRKADTASAAPTAKSIDVTISSYYFNVHYDYDATTNSYKRSEGGKPHTVIASAADKTGVQLSPKVVMALVVPSKTYAASDGYRMDYTTTGSGKVYLFQDGTEVEGTWSKASTNAPLLIKDATGAEIKLNAGQTWLTMVSSGGVAFK